MQRQRPLARPINVLFIGAVLMVLWMGSLLISFRWNLQQNRSHMLEAARTAARAAHEKDLAYRRWNAVYGPVYLPVGPRVLPNPYLPEAGREIAAPSGIVLTQVNPAYMNRQVYELEVAGIGIRSHITGLHPVRPQNAPDDWERSALEAFERGEEEVSGVVALEGASYLRLMRPLFVETSCLTCHRQDFKGDVRGGISVAVPMAPFQAIEKRHRREISLQHALLGLLGVSGISLGTWRLRQQVNQLRRGEESLRQSEERFRSIFAHAGAGMMMVDQDGHILQVNAAVCELLGYPEDELLKSTVERITHPDDRQVTARKFEAVRDGRQQRYRYEKRFLRADGSVLWADVSTTWFQDKGAIFGIGLFQNITDRMQAASLAAENEERLQHLAYHDTLTSLPNRFLFRDRLDHALAKARRSDQELALLFLDLDRFKMINDSLGHDLGDRLLCEMAVRLRALVREADTLARFGGDEFIVVLEQSDARQAGLVAQRILEEIARPALLDTHPLYLSASIGISLFPSDGANAETLIQCADMAMYCAKERGRNNYQFCTPELNARTRDQLRLENDLRCALEQGELVLYYQPQVDVATGEVVGMEALVRWKNPQRGVVPPASFIPLAEETGLIVPIGSWVLRTACLQGQEWIARGFLPLRMAVNISARQFRQKDLLDTIEAILRETGFDPALLELELTESMIMTDVEEAIRIMEDLTRLGVRLAIDDFGAGYSSLNYLKRFPIGKLKIDRSFVHDLTENERTAAVTASVIHLARRMNMEVVAEGVETPEQKEFLLLQGCKTGQGYLFGRPRPAAEIQPPSPPGGICSRREE